MKKNILLLCAVFALCSCGTEKYPDLYQQEPPTEAATLPSAAEMTTAAPTEAATEPSAAPTEASATAEATDTVQTEVPAETVPDQTVAATAAQEATPAADAAELAAARMDKYPELYRNEAKRVFDQLYDENDGCASIEFTLRDLDADGVPELILKHGIAEYNYVTTVYTIDAGCNVKVIGDNLIGSHTNFGYDTNSGALVLKSGHMGEGSCTWVKYAPGSEGVSVEKQVPVVYLDFNDFERQMTEMSIAALPFTDIFSFSKDREPKTYIYAADGSYQEYEGCNFKEIN